LIIYALQGAVVAAVNTIPAVVVLVVLEQEQALLLLPVIH
jgi:hypothetical protein